MATTELRHRTTSMQSIPSSNMSSERETFLHVPGRGLIAKAMIDSSPQQHGVVLKLHVPILYTILPEFLQKIIISFSFLSFLGPTWKQRYLILCGSFLYKFKDQASEVPNGAPFSLESTVVEPLSKTRFTPELGNLPPGYTSVFSVSSLRRQHYYAVSDDEEARLWMTSIKEAKQETIVRKMGHGLNMPYPSNWSYFDSLGKSLVKSKERIRQRLEDYNRREMEMSNFVEAGPIPRGFHG